MFQVVEFTALQFNMNEIVKLEAIFHRIDDSADGRVNLSELLDYIGLDRSDFAKRVFSIFDSDGSGTIGKLFILPLVPFKANCLTFWYILCPPGRLSGIYFELVELLLLLGCFSSNVCFRPIRPGCERENRG